MAKILPDHEIRDILEDVLVGADPELLDPNGIKLRLGAHIRFLSTDERKILVSGQFLKVSPGETVVITSMEKIDFTRDAVENQFPGHMLMGFITPTTTMMREGITQVSTKIDAGFKGQLNWSLRNASTTSLIIGYGEPIFKLTLFLLDEDEKPEIAYGEHPGKDPYHDSEGIVSSARHIPAQIPKNKYVSSSFEKLDPKKQLKEAGYPFNHIGTELVGLHGKFEMVSKDVALLRNEFENKANELSLKIEKETQSLISKLDETKDNLFDKVEALFNKRFMRVGGFLAGALPVMYGIVGILEGWFSPGSVAAIAIIVGLLILALTWTLSTRK